MAGAMTGTPQVAQVVLGVSVLAGPGQVGGAGRVAMGAGARLADLRPTVWTWCLATSACRSRMC